MGRALASSAAVVAVVAVWSAVAPSVLLSNLSYVGGAGVGCVLAAIGARRARGSARLGWAAVAVTEGAWAAANVYWLWFESVRHQPVPSPGPFDAMYLLGSASLLVGVGIIVRAAVRASSPTRLVLDGLLVASSLFFVAWSLVLGRLPRLDGVDDAITWAYPVVDVAVASLALLALASADRGRRASWLLLGAGLGVLAVCDSVWAYANLQGSFLSGGGAIDAAWSMGYVLLGLAALAGGTVDRGGPLVPERWNAVVPYVPFAFVIAVGVLVDASPDDDVRAAVGVFAVALLLVRQIIAVVENQRLARDLEQRVGDRTAELARSESLFRAVTQTISDAVVVLDDRFLVRYASPGLERISGYLAADVEGRGVVRLVHPADRRATVDLALTVAGRTGATERLRCRVRVADGSYAEAEITMANLLDHPEINGHLLAIRDVREQHALEERLRHRAEHDDLTGLANRAALVDAAAAAFGAERRPALVLLDLDGFKEVNDSLGHAVGDDLLIEVASRLQRAVGPGDVVARLGGDEFAVLVRGSTPATAIAQRLDRALRRPFVLGGRSIVCGASIGVTTVGAAPDELLRNADLAMYAAKARAEHGRGRVTADSERHASIQLFHDGMRRRMVRRLELEQALRGAAGRDELSVVFQPVVDVVTGAVAAGEALLRWHRDGVEIEPREFVPVAEDTGLIAPLGRWVLERACEMAASWPDDVGVAVNASVRQLVDADLVGDVEAVLRRTGLAPARLTIELTETAVMDHSDRVLARLRALKNLGVRLSIDDFGTGYSSLGRLRFLPVDEVKIDRAFVASGEESMAVVEAVLALAERLGLDVVAEGVEHVEQLWALRERGCRRAQGHLLGRPLPPAAFARAAGEATIDDRVVSLGTP